MAFQPVSLAIQEILFSHYVTDMAHISNANDVILQDKIEDLLNNLEIDLTTLSIGTDNPINYIRTQNLILQDTGFTLQTGSPATIIAKLEKNSGNESVLTIDRLNVDLIASVEDISVNSLTVNDDLTVDGSVDFTSSFTTSGSRVKAKETVTAEVTLNGSVGEARLILTSSSKENIFVRLRAVSSPDLSPVYIGAGSFAVNSLELYLDFDENNPPAQNATFTIHLADVIENQGQSSILQYLDPNSIPLMIKGGDNLNANPVASIIMHDGGSFEVGVNPTSINDGSNILKSNTFSKYGHNLSLMYILDDNTDDRLVITGMVGMEFFL